MVDYVSNPRAAARARRREAAEVASFVRRLDWLLIGSVAALVAYGLFTCLGGKPFARLRLLDDV